MSLRNEYATSKVRKGNTKHDRVQNTKKYRSALNTNYSVYEIVEHITYLAYLYGYVLLCNDDIHQNFKMF